MKPMPAHFSDLHALHVKFDWPTRRPLCTARVDIQSENQQHSVSTKCLIRIKTLDSRSNQDLDFRPFLHCGNRWVGKEIINFKISRVKKQKKQKKKKKEKKMQEGLQFAIRDL